MGFIAELNGVSYYSETHFASVGKATFANDLIGNALSADELSVDIIAGSGGDGRLLTAYAEPVVDANGNGVFVADGGHENPVGIPAPKYGDVITLWNGGHNRVIAKMYVSSVSRIAKDVYRISASSAIGLMIRRRHYGGIYQNTPTGTILAELFGDIPYSVDDMVANVATNGHLPIASARDNLHVLLQSIGASVLKDANGDPYVGFIGPETTKNISADDTAPSGSVSYNTHATHVVVVEHGFYETAYDEEVTLFDNTNESPVTDKTVEFDEPCYDLVPTGSITISDSGANYAVVSGVGTLTGKKYTHTREERVEATGATGEENIVAVRDNELVNALNSGALAERLVNYYGAANTAEVTVLGSDLYTGHHVLFTNIYGEPSEGYVEEADVTLSVMLDQSALRIATDYMIGPFGPDYDDFVIIDTSGTWTVPAEMQGKKVRVYCFGGARGGQAGYNGANGEGFGESAYRGGAGGNAGTGGQGFMLADDEMTLDAASYNVTIGAGGAGGASNGANGALGGNTTFDAISSAAGTETLQFLNIISGGIYGLKGDDGTAGANGGDRSNSGGSVGGYTGGASDGNDNSGRPDVYYYGGGGGGAAIGSNGGDARTPYVYSYHGPLRSSGGNGANATAPIQSDGYAEGGHGGHGGGGGGALGGVVQWIGGAYDYTAVGDIGTGGTGSAGGQGADGFVLILYHS